MGFPGGSDSKRICPQCGIPRFDPWRREWQPTPVFLPGEFHGQRNPVGYTVHGVPKSQTQLTNQHFVTVRKAPGKHEILTCDAGVTSSGIFFLACTVQSGTKSDKVSFHKCSGRLSLSHPQGLLFAVDPCRGLTVLHPQVHPSLTQADVLKQT